MPPSGTRIGDGELGLHLELGFGVGIQEGLEVETGDIVVATLHGVVGLVVEDLVGERRVQRDDLLSIAALSGCPWSAQPCRLLVAGRALAEMVTVVLWLAGWRSGGRVVWHRWPDWAAAGAWQLRARLATLQMATVPSECHGMSEDNGPGEKAQSVISFICGKSAWMTRALAHGLAQSRSGGLRGWHAL